MNSGQIFRQLRPDTIICKYYCLCENHASKPLKIHISLSDAELSTLSRLLFFLPKPWRLPLANVVFFTPHLQLAVVRTENSLFRPKATELPDRPSPLQGSTEPCLLHSSSMRAVVQGRRCIQRESFPHFLFLLSAFSLFGPPYNNFSGQTYNAPRYLACTNPVCENWLERV